MSCYCKKCKAPRRIIAQEINKDDIATFYLDCEHTRAFQLVTSKEDYK